MKKHPRHIAYQSLPCVFFLFFGFLQIHTAYTQDRCASHLILQERYGAQYSEYEQTFESWLKGKKEKFLSQRTAESITIPVVFHVLHNGEAVGSGLNISKERIDRQLATLNEDFNQQNPDRFNTLAEFQPLAANIDIQFVYAKQDPNGYAFDGINRQVANQGSYTYSQREVLGAEVIWDPEEYLNIWIVNIGGNGLGWAEFPETTLEGINTANIKPNTDGIAIDYVYLGDNPSSPTFESKGRTLTHEMGHYLGLRHIWGDGGCSLDDYCDDTPKSSERSLGCDLSKATCEGLDMVQNFMDYTNDACMSLFTEDQKLRMRTVLDNSPRRSSLKSSRALEEPPAINFDLGIVSNESIEYKSACQTDYKPAIIVKNFGLQAVDSFTVTLATNGNIISSQEIYDSLSSGAEMEVTFPDYQLRSSNLAQQFTYNVTLNQQSDDRVENNGYLEIIQLLQTANAPYQINFRESFNNWFIRNPDQENSWTLDQFGLYMHTFNNRSNFGERDAIISPIYDFEQLEIPEMKINLAQSDDTVQNKFTVYASFDCGQSFTEIVYSSYLDELTTAYYTSDVFYPENPLDWKSFTIDLSRYRKYPSICFKIELENRGANNVYIEQISIRESEHYDFEVSPIGYESLMPVYCNTAISSVLSLKNTGRRALTSFGLMVLEEGDTLLHDIYNKVILRDETISLALDSIPVVNRQGILNLISYSTLQDSDSIIYRQINLPYQLSCEQEAPPLRLNLSIANKNNLIIIDPNLDDAWSYDFSRNLIMSNPSIPNDEPTEDWLISPVISAENIDYLSLIFDVAYHHPFGRKEGLQIYLKSETDAYDHLLVYDKSGDSLATSWGNEEEMNPIYRNELVDLSPYLYMGNFRVLIKSINTGGASIFLKDLSLFLGQDTPPDYPNTLEPFVVYPNPAMDGQINLHFNLPEAESGLFRILDLQGRVIMRFDQPKILNQYVQFDISSLATGIYILHFQSNNINKSIRFLVK